MSRFRNFFSGGFGAQKQEDHGVIDLLESVSNRDWATSEDDRKEMDDIIKRLRYKHPRTPPRQSRLNRRDIGKDILQLGDIYTFGTTSPVENANIKIDTTAVAADQASSSKVPRGGLLRNFGSSVCSSKCGRSQGTNESADDSLGASVFTDRHSL